MAGSHYVSVANPDGSAFVGSVQISITISGMTCTNGMYWNGGACVPLTTISGANSLITAAAGRVALFALQRSNEITAHTSKLIIDATTIATGGYLCITRALGAGGACTPLSAQVGSTVTITSYVPELGQWYLSLGADAKASTSANVTLRIVQCTGNLFGSDCSVVMEKFGAPGVLGTWYTLPLATPYFVFEGGTKEMSLAVASVSSMVGSSAKPPLLYAKLGSLPDGIQFDLVGCNAPTCRDAQPTLIQPVEYTRNNGTWYIAMMNPNTVVLKVTTWNALACANNCTDAGTCDASSSLCYCSSTATVVWDCEPLPDNSLPVSTVYIILAAATFMAIACVVGSYFVEWTRNRSKAASGYSSI